MVNPFSKKRKDENGLFKNTVVSLIEASGFSSITYKNVIMIIVAWDSIPSNKKDYEPLLLIPIAFGMLLVNLFPGIMAQPTVNANGDTVAWDFTLFLYW